MKVIIIYIIAAIALLLFAIGLIKARKIAKDGNPEEVKEFNKSYWTYIITSVNGLLVVNLSSLLGFEFSLREADVKTQQFLAAGYLITLLFIFLFWAQRKFNEDEKMPVVIPQLSKSFFALLLAGLGIILKGVADTM
jgi:hypothetical protein